MRSLKLFCPRCLLARRLVAMSGKDCTRPVRCRCQHPGLFADCGCRFGWRQAARKSSRCLRRGRRALDIRLVCLEGTTGKLITSSTDAFALSGGVSFDCSGPAVADLDGDGAPEIVVGGMALRFNKAKKQLEKMFNSPVVGATWGHAHAGK